MTAAVHWAQINAGKAQSKANKTEPSRRAYVAGAGEQAEGGEELPLAAEFPGSEAPDPRNSRGPPHMAEPGGHW